MTRIIQHHPSASFTNTLAISIELKDKPLPPPLNQSKGRRKEYFSPITKQKATGLQPPSGKKNRT